MYLHRKNGTKILIAPHTINHIEEQVDGCTMIDTTETVFIVVDTIEKVAEALGLVSSILMTSGPPRGLDEDKQKGWFK